MVSSIGDTYPAVLGAAAAQAPDHVFLHCASERTASERAARDTVTYAELDRRSRQVAAGLLARGIGPGDRIAVAAANQAEWLELFFGAARIGVVVVTLNVRYRAAELDYMLNQAQVRLVVTAAKAGELDLEAFYPELTAFCAERLANYKVPRQIELVDELPVTPTGKVAKAVLRDRYLAAAERPV